MSPQTNSHLQLVSDELAQLGRQMRDIADEQLPRIADAAQRTGHSVARVSGAAGRSAVEHLRAVPPALSGGAIALSKSSTLRKSLRFVAARPALAVAGGLVAVGAGLALWRLSKPKAEETPEAQPQRQTTRKQRRR